MRLFPGTPSFLCDFLGTERQTISSFKLDRWIFLTAVNDFDRPFNNPTETYRYYSMPFCHTHSSVEEEQRIALEENVELQLEHNSEKRMGALRHRLRMGESLVGDRRETAPYEVTFMDSVEWRLLCKKELDQDDLTKLKDAIHDNYFFEMFVEDLPMWGYIGDVANEDIIMGEVEGSKTFLFPHLHFYLGYHDDQIVAARVTTDVSLQDRFEPGESFFI